MASTQAQAATEAATPPEEAHTEDSRAESRVQAEEDVVVASGGTRSRGAGKNVTIDFPANDPSGRKQFVGAVKMGKPHGQGVLVWESGSRYEGQFRRGDLNGMGTYYWANGTVYTGEWVDGAMHGRGMMVTATGDKYEGEWSQNRKHGIGTYTWGNGDSFRGEFSDDVMHGRGTCRWPNGREVELEFEDEFPVVANRAALALWVCFVTLSIVFLLSLFPNSPLRSLHSLWPLSPGLIPGLRRSLGGDAAADTAGTTVGGLTGMDWLAQFPYYLHLVLLFANQRLLREFFAQVIWKVAQIYCHCVGPSALLLGCLSHQATWRCGICLGYISICGFFFISFSVVHAASAL